MLKALSSLESDKFLTLDFLRFIACLSVIFFHYRLDIQNEHLRMILDGLFGRSELFVDFFFILSGFIIAFVYISRLKGRVSYFKFMQKRVARLVPLHWLLLIAYIGLWQFSILLDMPVRNPDRYDASCILPHALLIHAWGFCNKIAFNYVSWSISAEMGMYIITPILFFFARRFTHGLLVMSLGITALLALVFSTPDHPYLEWSTGFSVARALPAFLLGIYLFKIKDRLGWVPIPQILCWVFLGVFFSIRFVYPDISLYVLLLLMYGAAFMAVSSDMNRPAPHIVQKFAWLGQLTYGAYMLHPLIFTIGFSVIGQKILKFDNMMGDILILALVPCVFIAAVFSLIMLEHPARVFVSRLGWRKRSLKAA